MGLSTGFIGLIRTSNLAVVKIHCLQSCLGVLRSCCVFRQTCEQTLRRIKMCVPRARLYLD